MRRPARCTSATATSAPIDLHRRDHSSRPVRRRGGGAAKKLATDDMHVVLGGMVVRF